jgi:hypothetical protein
LERVRQYAAAADWRTATTTFYASDPREPHPIVAVEDPDDFAGDYGVMKPDFFQGDDESVEIAETSEAEEGNSPERDARSVGCKLP